MLNHTPVQGLRIAFHGYGRAGKDTAGEALLEVIPGMVRVAMGDFIKRDTREVILRYTGIDVMNCTDEQKEMVRGFLVEAGNHRYRQYLDELLREAGRHLHVVNTRIFRVEECEAWVAAGGVIYEVVRPGNGPKEPQEARHLEAARERGLIRAKLVNDATVEAFKAKVRTLGLAHYRSWLSRVEEAVLAGAQAPASLT